MCKGSLKIIRRKTERGKKDKCKSESLRGGVKEKGVGREKTCDRRRRRGRTQRG